MKIELFAFDLDGTLLDTAPDFLYAVNLLRKKYKFGEADYEQVRSRVSQGAASLAAYALNLQGKSNQIIESHRQELLDIYEDCCLTNTKMFDGVEELLNELNEKKIKWGIVTNKSEKYTKPIIEKLRWHELTDAVICPEDVSEGKPNPEGIIRALDILNASNFVTKFGCGSISKYFKSRRTMLISLFKILLVYEVGICFS